MSMYLAPIKSVLFTATLLISLYFLFTRRFFSIMSLLYWPLMVRLKSHNNDLKAGESSEADPARNLSVNVPEKHKEYREFVSKQIDKYGLDCYLSFTSDCHLSEYVGPEDQRVFFLTGFEGSNGIAISGRAPGLITDSRYFLRAQSESSYPLFKGELVEYILQNKFKRISFNRRYISHAQYERFIKKLAEMSPETRIIPTDEEEHVARRTTTLFSMENKDISNFLNLTRRRRICWCSGEQGRTKSQFIEGDCPCKYDTTAIHSYLKSFSFEESKVHLSGISYKDKISKIQKILRKNKRVIIAELDTICWILNLRAQDIEYNPVMYAYLAIEDANVIMFTNHSVRLEEIEVRPYSAFDLYLESISEENNLVSGSCSEWLFSQLNNVEFTDEIRGMQAKKNDTELLGMVLSYVYDGIALTELFAFLEKNTGYTERDVARKLEEIKGSMPGYAGPSFETIVGTGPNAAIVHHSSTETPVSGLLLLDSGSHYRFGTTDTTRMMFVYDKRMSNHDEIVHNATLVLKGQLKAMMRRYTENDSYSTVDTEARTYLKAENKDFGHATGHGVGHFLCVHEHPPTISCKSEGKIQPGHVFSIEPGYYVDGKYGIRLENLVYSKRGEGGIDLINITMVPYHQKMIDAGMLDEAEKSFLNLFHEKCYFLLAEYVSDDAYAYLVENTKRIQ